MRIYPYQLYIYFIKISKFWYFVSLSLSYTHLLYYIILDYIVYCNILILCSILFPSNPL